MQRSAGILLPVFSLPSNYGIGTFGKEAYKFIDFLDEANQSYWQLLPLGPTSYGDSPYQSFSSFAGNPYFIDLDLLIEDGLLNEDDVKDLIVEDGKDIDYKFLYDTRYDALRKAYKNGIDKYYDEFIKFCEDEIFWLDDYTLFVAIKKYFNDTSWIEWEDKDIRFRKAEAINHYKELLKDEIEFYKFVQFLFYKQYLALREYAHEKGIKIIGDIPIYVSLDSVEVWMEPENFILDENYLPKEVSGVPPDYFNSDGQLWGNPLYDYDYQEKNNFKWWIKRINGCARVMDVIRIDHFRGFESFWAVPYGEETARNGKWVKGPSTKLLNVIKDNFKDIEFIAEDLGYHSKEVQAMLDDFGYPGMKVLEFAFDAREPSDHAPHNYTKNYVCYIGTHDNETIIGYRDSVDEEVYNLSCDYIGIKSKEEFAWGFVRAGMSSVANLFVVQLQDYLELGNEARINTPGTLGNNWKWRLKKNQLGDDLSKKISKYTNLYKRGKQNG